MSRMGQALEDSASKTIWTKTGDDVYGLGTPSSGNRLPLGVYSLHLTIYGEARFKHIARRDEDLVRFKGEADTILSEVQFFWTRSEIYKKLRLPYRRGILLYGPPGTGKSSLIRIALEDVVARGGVGFLIDSMRVFSVCYAEFRKLQPDTPLVAVIEDLESFCETGQERELLEVLDGQGAGVTNTVFIATSNHIEKLPDRIKNRPSRFDRRIEVGFPTAEQRDHYFNSLLKAIPADLDTYQANLVKRNYIEDTGGMSLAHAKALFTSVVILGADYDATMTILKQMKIVAEPAAVEEPDEYALEQAESRLTSR